MEYDAFKAYLLKKMQDPKVQNALVYLAYAGCQFVEEMPDTLALIPGHNLESAAEKFADAMGLELREFRL